MRSKRCLFDNAIEIMKSIGRSRNVLSAAMKAPRPMSVPRLAMTPLLEIRPMNAPHNVRIVAEVRIVIALREIASVMAWCFGCTRRLSR